MSVGRAIALGAGMLAYLAIAYLIWRTADDLDGFQ